MNKFLQKVAKIFLGLSMAAGVGVAVASNSKEASSVEATTSSWDLTKASFSSSSTTSVVWSSTYLTMTLKKGSSQTNANNYLGGANAHTRMYSSQVLSFTPASGYQINSVTMTATGNSYCNYTAKTNCTVSGSGSSRTITPTTKTALFEVSPNGNRITTVSFDYQATGGGGTTYTVTISTNNSNYGTVSSSSVTSVASGTSISASSNVLTVGSTTVTATPTTSTSQYTYAFGSWTGIPAGGKVTANITVTANFTRTFTPAHGGTSADPYSITDALGITAEFSDEQIATNGSYVKGVVKEMRSDISDVTDGFDSDGFAYFYISDGTNDFPCYTVYNCSKTKTDPLYVNVGREVVVYGYLQIWGNQRLDYSSSSSGSECYIVSSSAAHVTSFSASVSGTHYTGEKLTESDFSVTASLQNGPSNLTLTSGFEWTVDSTDSETLDTGTNNVTVTFNDASTTIQVTGIEVHATGISFASATASVALNKTLTLTPTVTPSNATDTISWTSSVPGVATVADGLVTPVSTGNTVITATINGHSATCTVTVTAAVYKYEIVFGTEEGTTGITDFSNTTIVCPSEVTLDNITGNVYGSSTNAQVCLRFGKSGTTGSFDASISGNYYITSVVCNLKYYGSDTTATFSVTPSGGSPISKSLTDSWADYTYDVSTAKVKKVTLGTDINGKRAYLSGFTINYAPLITLSSITLSGTYPTTFTKGDTFSHSGMVVTANYSNSTSAVVTGSATWSSPDMSTTGVKTVTVSYSDAYGSASTTYSITVSYAAPTSISLSSNSASVALEETFNLSTITVTVNPSATADQTAYAWSLYDDGDLVEDTDYVWLSPEIMSYTAGTFVFRCTSTEDGSVYAEFTLTVTGDPLAHLKDEGDNDVTEGSMTVFADAGVISYSVTTENFQGSLTYTWSSSNTSAISVKEDADEMCDYQVNAAGSARLSCRIQGSVKGDVTVYVDVTVSAVTVTSVTWTAPTIDVFSGATLTSSDVSSWNVKYATNSGKTDQTPAVGDITVKVNGTAVGLPYTWKGSDNGHTLGVEVGGVSSSTTTVTITQTINNVYASNTDTNTVSWTASAAADLGSQISSEGGKDTGTISTGDYEWDYTRTLTSLTSGKSDNISFQGSTWIQLGSNNAMESIVFTTSAIPGTIKSVSVVVATAGSHELTIDVGGTKYLEGEGLTLYSGTAAAANPDPADCVETGTGSSSGAITITIAPTGSTKKAMVIRSISVTYETEGSGTTNIANNASHKAAQRAAVAFAQTFNAAMDETENCTTGLDAAWTTCSNAYNSFKTAAAALGETEEAWAKNLVKYATKAYSDDSGEACIERMLKTYEICVQKHGKTAFMDDLVSLGAPHVSPLLNIIGENTNTVAIIVIISMVSVTAIGGYFFLRKRKENI